MNLPTRVPKPSVFIAIFTMGERNGWLAPGIGLFLAAVGNAAAGRALSLKIVTDTKPIDYARNCVAKEFLASGFDWLLMIDNDMAPPLNLFEMLDRSGSQMQILVPKFYRQVEAVRRVADSAIADAHTSTGEGGIALCWQPRAEGLGQQEWCELASAGTGVMFVRRRVFEQLGNEPWFRFTYDNYGQIVEGEDEGFCKKARRVGFSTWGNQQFEADHYKSFSLSALARPIRVIVPSGKVPDRAAKGATP
jgi:hypothetical protein